MKKTTASSVKRERFKTVAARRAQKVLDDLDNLCKCANKNTYDYTDEDVKKMLKAISEKVTLLKVTFVGGSRPNKKTFEF